MIKSLKIRSYFTQFLLYNLVFISLQLAYVCSISNNFLSALPIPNWIYLELLFILGIHLFLYLLFSLLQTFMLWGLIQQHPLNIKFIERWHISIWTLSICALISSNCYFFPLSLFSLLCLPISRILIFGVMVLSLLILGMLLLNSLFIYSKKRPAMPVLALMIMLCFIIYPMLWPHIQKQRSTKKNIILIGIDSLSPRYINAKDTPTLSHFIEKSVYFKEAISPLARTFPAWSTILTGLYPLHHHAIYNLIPLKYVQKSSSLAWNLQKSGYQTLFATDNRQFSNLGEEFGFQTVIGPTLGVKELLLSAFNDFPLSNMLVNSPFGRWLFPYNHMNRASYFSYYPGTFDKALKSSLRSKNPNAPLLMAVHYTLPHWPYGFATSLPPRDHKEYTIAEQQDLYRTALHAVDHQVDSLLQSLDQYGYLENSMVILLSDHGEVLYIKGSRQTLASQYQGQGSSTFANYIKRKTGTILDRSIGHGSDLLSTDQYHCLLAFKLSENNQLKNPPQTVSTRVALIDIMPTIQDFLNIPLQKPVDGISLLKNIEKKTPLTERSFVMESGMLPNQFLNRETAKKIAQLYFEIDKKSGFLQVRDDAIKLLNAKKLYAIIQGDWVLALYPDDKKYIHVIQHLPDGKWTDDMQTEFAKQSPALSMLKTLGGFYDNQQPF